MKNSKGITLIALVITIIVMLILVGVTINVAFNSGLFTQAQTAKRGTNLAKEKEMVQAAALGYLNDNGYVDLATFVTEKDGIEGYTLTNNTTYVTASKENGGYLFDNAYCVTDGSIKCVTNFDNIADSEKIFVLMVAEKNGELILQLGVNLDTANGIVIEREDASDYSSYEFAIPVS